MEPAITPLVALPRSIVSGPVDLYHQPCCQADEVRHEGTARGLAPELVPGQLPAPQVRPESSFDSGHCPPQLASAQDLLARRHLNDLTGARTAAGRRSERETRRGGTRPPPRSAG